MNKIGLLIVAGVLNLAGYSPTPFFQTVEAINVLTVPVLHSEPGAIANNAQAVTCYFQNNMALTGCPNHSLKNHCLQNVKRHGVPDRHSRAYQMYSILTRLEQMAPMNDIYRRENNVVGLQGIDCVPKNVLLAS